MKYNKYILLRPKVCFVLMAFLFSFNLYAQTGIMRGYVYDEATGEPISFADVFVENTNIGSSTDLNGFYNLSGLESGNYNFVVQYLGYEQIVVPVELFEGQILNKSFYLSEGGVSLDEINVTAERGRARTEIQVSKITVSAEDIKMLPAVGAEADIVQYLQVLPGVVSTGDQGGQLFIRGGSIVQNKILLDGLPIYNPFHTLGFFSVFETELIRSADVYSAGFNAEYGGRVSAIVDIKTREGNKTNTGGFVSISPFLGKVLVETPLKKFKKDEGSISLVFTGKKSLIQNTSIPLYPHALNDKDVGLPFDFRDLYGKISFVSGNGSKVNVFGFDFNDNYVNPAVANVSWVNQGVGTNFSLVPANSSIIVDGNVGAAKYGTSFFDNDKDLRNSDIVEFGAGLNFTFFMPTSEVKYGIDIRGIKTNFDFVNPFGLTISQNQNTSELSGFVKYKAVLGDFVLEPSFRIMYYAGQQRFSPEPRLGLKYNLTNWMRLKFAGGLYSQNILGTTNDRDIVNLFNAFLTGPESEVQDFDGNRLQNKLTKAVHGVAGLEVDLSKNVSINVEPYYKRFSQIVVINRNKLSATQPDYVTESADAYGIDFSLESRYNKWFLWSTVSHSYVNRDDGEQVYPAIYDRRNNINVLLSYDFDRKKKNQVSLRWNFGSGFPFTKTRGFYNEQNFGNGILTDVLTNNPDNIGVLYSDVRNSGRLPTYHRLDLSYNKKINFSKRFRAEINAAVTNAYNRQNIFFFDRVKYSRENQLPILPSVSLKLFY